MSSSVGAEPNKVFLSERVRISRWHSDIENLVTGMTIGESVRIGKCQNRKVSESESVRFGKGQNSHGWRMFFY